MQFAVAVFTFCIAFNAQQVESRKLPDYFPRCTVGDNFDPCVMKAVQSLKPMLKDGIPKLNIPPLEPLKISRLNINRDQPNLRVKAKLDNIVIHGGSNFKITKFKSDTNALTLDAIIKVPFANVTCDYDVDGRLLLIPLRGKGLFEGNFTDIIADVKGNGEMVTNKKGVKYIKVKTIKLRVKLGNQVVKFTNKDNNRNNDLIAQTAANFVNQNTRQVFQIVKGPAEEVAEAVAIQLANRIFETIPANEIIGDQ